MLHVIALVGSALGSKWGPAKCYTNMAEEIQFHVVNSECLTVCSLLFSTVDMSMIQETQQEGGATTTYATTSRAILSIPDRGKALTRMQCAADIMEHQASASEHTDRGLPDVVGWIPSSIASIETLSGTNANTRDEIVHQIHIQLVEEPNRADRGASMDGILGNPLQCFVDCDVHDDFKRFALFSRKIVTKQTKISLGHTLLFRPILETGIKRHSDPQIYMHVPDRGSSDAEEGRYCFSKLGMQAKLVDSTLMVNKIDTQLEQSMDNDRFTRGLKYMQPYDSWVTLASSDLPRRTCIETVRHQRQKEPTVFDEQTSTDFDTILDKGLDIDAAIMEKTLVLNADSPTADCGVIGTALWSKNKKLLPSRKLSFVCSWGAVSPTVSNSSELLAVLLTSVLLTEVTASRYIGNFTLALPAPTSGQRKKATGGTILHSGTFGYKLACEMSNWCNCSLVFVAVVTVYHTRMKR